MNKKTKLSLSILVNEIDGAVRFDVAPPADVRQQGNRWYFDWSVPIQSKFVVKVTLIERHGSQSHIKIDSVRCNDVELQNLDVWGKYIIKGRATAKRTYGYMDEPGVYIMSIHQNALIHNYLVNFLHRCRPETTVDQK